MRTSDTQDDNEKGPRRVIVRRMAGLALLGSAAALTAATSAPAAGPLVHKSSGHVDAGLVWLASSEGGEGGESGAPAAVSPDAAYLTSLGELQGHLNAAMELCRDGKTKLAAGHLDRPDGDTYQVLSSEMAEHGAADFSADLTAFADAVEGAKPLVEIEKAYSRLSERIAADRAKAVGDPGAIFEAMVELTRSAADDYGRGVSGGALADAHEYRDARGYMQSVKALAAVLAASPDARVKAAAGKVAELLAATDPAFPSLTPEGPIPADASLLFATAARIEIAGLKLK